MGIATALPVGRGHGPLNHLHSLITRVVPQVTAHSPFPFVASLIRENQETWDGYVKHPFVQQIGRGTLPKECFIYFIKQDYLYLKYYARAHGLLAAKASDILSIQSSATIMLQVARESKMLESFCVEWGLSSSEIATTPESTVTAAYGSFILDSGLKGDDVSLLVALAACLLGYGEVGLWLAYKSQHAESGTILEGNPYRKWVEDYSGQEYQAACCEGIYTLEARIAADPPSPSRFRELSKIWSRCVELEKGFWDMAISLS